MTPTTDVIQPSHDTLSDVTTKGTDRKSFRLGDDPWNKLGANAAAIGKDRTAVLKALIDWFNREPGAALPERPPAAEAADD